MKVAKKAVRSVNAVKKSMGSEKEVIRGTVADASLKQNLTSVDTVGMSIGTTLNMGNYESMRIDCWGLEAIAENETREMAAMRLRDDLVRIIGKVQTDIENDCKN